MEVEESVAWSPETDKVVARIAVLQTLALVVIVEVVVTGIAFLPCFIISKCRDIVFLLASHLNSTIPSIMPLRRRHHYLCPFC